MGDADVRETSVGLEAAQLAVWHDIVDGGWALMMRVNSAMSAEGLATSDLRILEVLSKQNSFGITELAAAAHVSISTLSRQVSRLVELGDIERVSQPDDGRARNVRLTRRGRASLQRHLSVRDRVIAECVVEPLSTEEFEALGTAFAKIRANLR